MLKSIDIAIAGEFSMGTPTSIVQQAYAAFGRGVVAAVLNLVAEKVDWEFVGCGKMPVGAVSSILRCATTCNGRNRSLIHSARMPVQGRADKPKHVAGVHYHAHVNECRITS
jgi:ketosteroid isomerase-like protein